MALCSSLAATAQRDEPDHPYTIHVYSNLMEVEALVLDSSNEPLRHVNPSQFAISLDAGPIFAPSFVRAEGDDPLSLSIFLDLSDREIAHAVPILRAAIPALAPANLRPRDHVSLYVMDCALIRSNDDMPANREELARAFDRAVNHPALHGEKNKPARCGDKNQLWDSLGIVAKDLSGRPDRRVLLLVSNGYDGKSATRWTDLRRLAATQGIALFGVTYGPAVSFLDFAGEPNPLAPLCASTGGLLMHPQSERELSESFANLLKIVRGRYTLQFRRPGNATAGMHNIEVTLKHTNAIIRVAGTTVPLPSDEERAGPDGLPLAPTTSVIGTKRPSSPK